MPRVVHIIGLGAGGLADLSPGLRAEIMGADFLAGGTRHLAAVGPARAETLAITSNLDELASRLARRGECERCVVLASGDPLFFGIGRFLGEALGRDQIRVEPAPSSMQLAFSRAGLSWDDAIVASVHGRDLKLTLLPLLGRPKIGLFTRDGRSPSEVARFFRDRGLTDYHAFVGEELGGPNERWTSTALVELTDRTFSDLNFLILLRPSPARLASTPGLPDEAFDQPATGPVLLTHADVRAVTLSRFRDLPDGPIWDIGAGLGGVSIELSGAFPHVEVVAVERSDESLPFLRRNRSALSAWNLRIVDGEAPACLTDEPPPAAVFLGGSGGRLGPILDLVTERLASGGLLVANFVALQNLSKTLDRLSTAGWRPRTTQVQVAHDRPLGGQTTFVPLRPVWIVTARKPSP